MPRPGASLVAMLHFTAHTLTTAVRATGRAAQQQVRLAALAAAAQANRAWQRADPAAVACLLLGTTVGMAVPALSRAFHLVYSVDSSAVNPLKGTVAGCALIAVSFGVRFPQRVALWLCVQAWRRFVTGGRGGDGSLFLFGSSGPDRALHWIVLSVVALLTGVTAALLPLLVRAAGSVHEWMHTHFLWSAGPLAIMQAAIVLAAVLPTMFLAGLSMAYLHHVSCPSGRWETRASAWLLIGGGAGTLIAAFMGSATGRPDLTLVAAALPALFLSLMAAAQRPGKCRPTVPPFESPDSGAPEPSMWQEHSLPAFRDTRPRLLRTTIVAVGGAGAGALGVWTITLASLGISPAAAVCAMLISAGIGVWVGCRRAPAEARSMAVVAAACAGAGTVVAISAWTVWLTPTNDTAIPSVGIGAISASACLGLFAAGFTTSYGRRTLLQRVAHRATEGARILSRTLTAAALMIWIVAPVAVRLAGPTTALALIALFLAALGAVVAIRERSGR